MCFSLATTAELSALKNADRGDLPDDFSAPDIRVRVRGTKNPSRDWFVPIVTREQQVLLEFVAKYADGTGGRLFGSSIRNIRRDLAEACKSADIEPASPHDFRRAGGQWLIDSACRSNW